MKKLYPIHIVKICIIAALALLSNAGWTQPTTDLFKGSGYAGLRHVDLNQITTTDFRCDSSYFYLNSDSVTNDWVLNQRAVYAYDNQGRESIRDISLFKEDRWLKEQQIRSTYLSEFLNTREEFSWNETANQWNAHTQHKYDYNYVGLINEIKTLRFKGKEWIADIRTNYTYNTEFLVEIESYYVWNDELNEWNPDSRNLYVYNDEQDVSKEVFQVWVDSISDWMNISSEVYKFDDSNNIVSTINRVWDKLQGTWVNNSVVSTEYNSEGLPLRIEEELLGLNTTAIPTQSDLAIYDPEGNIDHLVTSHWDNESRSWDMYQKQINFWSQHVYGNLHTAEKEIRCMFSNPYTIGLPWYCESLKPDVVYTLRVYDLQGRIFYSDQFLGSSTFRIEQHLEKGFYIFEIIGGLDKHYEKVYVKS